MKGLPVVESRQNDVGGARDGEELNSCDGILKWGFLVDDFTHTTEKKEKK